jgi:hypothetical protein
MPRFTAGSVITVPSGYGSRRSGYRFDGGQIVLSASDAARLNRATGGNGRPTRGGYSIPAEAFMNDAYYRALDEIAARQKAERQKIDEANGVRYMTPKEADGYVRWQETRNTHRMGWEQYQREILNSDEHQVKRVARGGVRSQQQAERLVEIIQSRGMAFSVQSTPVSYVNIAKNALGGVDLNGPVPLVWGNSSGNTNLFWKGGQVFLYRQSHDVVGGENWNWAQVDPKQVAELLKLGPA